MLVACLGALRIVGCRVAGIPCCLAVGLCRLNDGGAQLIGL